MLRIEELVLRVPGLGEEQARSLGNDVSRHLADGLPAQQRDRHLGPLDLSVRIPAGTLRSQMAKLIAEVVLKGLI